MSDSWGRIALRIEWAGIEIKGTAEISLFVRVWFNGRMKASQALDEGSIPFTRFEMPNGFHG